MLELRRIDAAKVMSICATLPSINIGNCGCHLSPE